ncbi:hypothetical protein [Virgibacillus litoralis]|uniref:Uncharacterized protein n=1 Tax=Virgibacillus litoralis TaxID=578221 RepID=A0ABS4HBN2_9BACI|nr:hypothetical protein [Virgibacillus litoralis]MBP1948301.1 hypothetical protein [Virgibacillus litoralis]
MKKFYYRGRFFWHQLRLRELSTVVSDCLDERFKHELEKKINYHEEAAMNYIVKDKKSA